MWNGRLYVMGGRGVETSVEWYDLERNEWIEVEEEEEGRRRQEDCVQDDAFMSQRLLVLFEG